MAKIYSTGPAHAYIAQDKVNPAGLDAPAGVSTRFYYLGTCEDAPEIDLLPAWKPAMSSLGGSIHPFARSYLGLEGTVVLPRMNRFNWVVYQMLCALPTSKESTPGKNKGVEIGTLVPLEESTGVTLIITFPYQRYSAYADLPKGYRFVCCTFEGPNNLKPGTRELLNSLIFRAGRLYNPNNGEFITYDYNVGGLPKTD